MSVDILNDFLLYSSTPLSSKRLLVQILNYFLLYSSSFSSFNKIVSIDIKLFIYYIHHCISHYKFTTLKCVSFMLYCVNHYIYLRFFYSPSSIVFSIHNDLIVSPSIFLYPFNLCIPFIIIYYDPKLSFPEHHFNFSYLHFIYICTDQLIHPSIQSVYLS